MDAGEPFSLTAICCDARRGTGGELLVVEKAYKSGWKSPSERKQGTPLEAVKLRKLPHHYENSTRNILLPSGEVRKIHIRLIRKFNNLIVL